MSELITHWIIFVINMLFAMIRYENLMQINLESSEVDEISEINTKLLRVSIVQSPRYSQNGALELQTSNTGFSVFSK